MIWWHLWKEQSAKLKNYFVAASQMTKRNYALALLSTLLVRRVASPDPLYQNWLSAKKREIHREMETDAMNYSQPKTTTSA